MSASRLRWETARKVLVLGVLAVLTAVLAAVWYAAPASAAARVDVSPAPSTEGATTVTLSGSGFQYQPNAPGGIYVGFGSVQDPATNSWAPSQGGKSGTTFGYADGSVLLVAFAGGDSASAANATIDANGNWTAQMTIPGAVFGSVSGNPHAGQAQEGAQIDCTQVQCGIITFGAHGMVNANNESFTPVSFVTPQGETVSGSGGTTSFTDDATQLEIPAGGEDAATTEPGGSSAEQPAESTETAEDAEDAPAAVQQSTEPAEASGGISSTTLVFGVLGFAVLVLVVAVVVALVRRARARRPAPQAEPAAPPGSVEEAPTGEPAATGTMNSDQRNEGEQ